MVVSLLTEQIEAQGSLQRAAAKDWDRGHFFAVAFISALVI
jgi:hypothetical protein